MKVHQLYIGLKNKEKSFSYHEVRKLVLKHCQDLELGRNVEPEARQAWTPTWGHERALVVNVWDFDPDLVGTTRLKVESLAQSLKAVLEQEEIAILTTEVKYHGV